MKVLIRLHVSRGFGFAASCEQSFIMPLFIYLSVFSRSVHSLISHVDLRNIEVVIAVLIAGYHVVCNVIQLYQTLTSQSTHLY